MIFTLSLNTATAKTININDASSYNQTGLSLSEQIQAIIDSASAGDTINFLGNFYKDLTLIINKNLNIITNVGTTISNSNPHSSLNTIFFINGSSAAGTTISGFNLINNNTNGNGIAINNTKNIKISKNNISANNSGVYVDKSTNITVDNNNIKKSDEGVYVKDSTDIAIEKNTISENNEGIYLENTNNTTIKSNTITKNEKNGITIKNTRKTVIEYNNITQNKKNGIYSYNTSNTRINNNTIKNNLEDGILTENNAKDLTIKGNIISGNHYGIHLNSIDNSGLTIKTNSINNNDRGVNFGQKYDDHNSKDISSNHIAENYDKDVDAKDSKYEGNLKIGTNWYGANEYRFTNICPKINGPLGQAKGQTSNGFYTISIQYKNGTVMEDLPDIEVVVYINGKKMYATLKNGKLSIDIKNLPSGSTIIAYIGSQKIETTVTNQDDNELNGIGGTNDPGNGGNGGNGPGGTGGNGNKAGPGNSQGNGLTNSGIANSKPSPADAGSSSSGDTANTQSSGQQPGQAKEIMVDENNILKMDDTQTLTALIIILLFGSIIMGYIIKKRTKETSF